VAGFYDKKNKLIGTAVGSVNNLGPGDTKPFSAMGVGDFSDADASVVQVDTIIE
jgi:hypothetical protein